MATYPDLSHNADALKTRTWIAGSPNLVNRDGVHYFTLHNGLDHIWTFCADVRKQMLNDFLQKNLFLLNSSSITYYSSDSQINITKALF